MNAFSTLADTARGERFRLIFAGSGGQGLITASIVLAEAAIRFEGWNAVQTQLYGPEARGGLSRSDLIISPDEINYPRVTQPNILICLSQQAYDRYAGEIRPGGLLLTDSRLVHQKPTVDARQWSLPFHETVTEKLGSAQSANICMLGALVAITGIVHIASLQGAVKRRFSGTAASVNLEALELGRTLAGASEDGLTGAHAVIG
jgi:2-oxoglutarate ferredoxin oxidoreductase subunit gamma